VILVAQSCQLELKTQTEVCATFEEGNWRTSHGHRNPGSDHPKPGSEINHEQIVCESFHSFVGSVVGFCLVSPEPPAAATAGDGLADPKSTPDSDIVDVNIRRVRLPITVQDKKKQFVSGLTQGDFVILEDKIPQTIDSFTSEANNNLPLYVAVLMDTSPQPPRR